MGAALMGETIRSRFRGRAVGTVQAGWAVGWGLSVILFTILFFRLPACTRLACYVLDWHFPCSAHRLHSRQGRGTRDLSRSSHKQGALLVGIFSSGIMRTTLLAALLALGAQGGYHAVTTWLPLYLSSTRGLTALNTGGYLSVVIVGAFSGLSRPPLSDGCDRAQADAHPVCRLLLVAVISTPVSPSQTTHAGARLSLRLLPFRIVQSHGCVLQRAFPHVHAGFWLRLCL